MAAKNREFVSEHHDLELLELARAQPQRRHRKRTPKQQVCRISSYVVLASYWPTLC
jgi:hypothetical protein